MKTMIIPILSLFITGCATSAPMSYREHCALKGMVLAGITDDSESASAYNWKTGSTVTAYSSSTAVSCKVPESDEEKCEVSRLAQIAEPRAEYNGHLYSKRLITGFGYYALIVPGIVAKVLYDDQLGNVITKSRDIAQTIPACSDERRIPAAARDRGF